MAVRLPADPAPGYCLLADLLGRLGYAAGVDDLFWSESAREQVFNGLTCGLFAELLLVRYLLDPDRERFAFRVTLLPVKDPAVRRLGAYLLLLWVPALLVLGGFKLFSHGVLAGHVRVWPLYCGLVLSLGVGSGVIALAGRLRPGPPSADAGPSEGTPGPRTRDEPLHRIAAATAALYLVGLGAVYARHASGAEVSPVVVLCVILGLLNAVYGFVAYRAPGLQHVVFVALIVSGIAANARWANPSADYKLTLPGREEYYATPLVLEEDSPETDAQGKRKRLDHYYDLLQRQADGWAPKPDLIPSEEPLRKMRER